MSFWSGLRTSLVLAMGGLVAQAACAVPTLLFTADLAGAQQVDVTVRVQGAAPDGLAGIHFDLFYDTAALQLQSATAGGFFASADPADPLWTDTVSAGLAPGDALETQRTDASTGPDTLGFDFIEVLGNTALADGVLARLSFLLTPGQAAVFSSNDLLLINGTGVGTAQAGERFAATTVGTVAEPGSLALAGAACLAAMWARRRRQAC